MSGSNQNNNKKKIKQYAVYVAMALLCVASFWLIFAPSEKQKKMEKSIGGAGLNMDIPEPSRKKGIIDDKKKAYEQQQMVEQKNERMKTLSDFVDMVSIGDEEKPDEPGLIEASKEPRTYGNINSKRAPENSLTRSTQAYKNVNQDLQHFYAPVDKEDTGVKRLKEELERLKTQLTEQEAKGTVDEQVVLMEKSFEMASRYMPQPTPNTLPAPMSGIEKETLDEKKEKNSICEVSLSHDNEVSAMKQHVLDSEIVRELSTERNLDFINGVHDGSQIQKNTILACIYDDQVIEGIESSKSVRIRLQEDMVVGDMKVSRNSLLTGQAKILGERLDIVIESIEYNEKIVNVDIVVYDTDGQKGIFIPNSVELNAVKEMGANMGSNVGTSVTFSQSAGQQIAADLGKGVIQGASQYISKKMRTIKISLKAGYRIFLLPKQNS